MTELIKSVTDGRTKFTTKTKSVTDFVTNKGFLTATVTDGRTDVASKPIFMMDKPDSAINVGKSV